MKETGNAPEHTKRFDRPSGLSHTHVGCFPPELRENSRYDLLASAVVPAYEHGRGAALELRIHHARAANRIESLHEANALKLPLKTLHQGIVEIGEELQYSVFWRRVCDGVGRIDDNLAREVGKTRSVECLSRYAAFHRQHNQFREFRGFIKAANAAARILLSPSGKFASGAGAYHYGMTVFEKTGSESCSHITRS
jgi:hypothetical protein